jgi:thiol-disulfide isomerase/thioredoxin
MKNIFIIIAVVAILGGVYYSVNNTSTENLEDNTNQVVRDDERVGEVPTGSNGLYVDYDESLLAKADGGDVVLFFHAGWCPTCKALERDVQNNLSDIPQDLTILKLNYDKESELKKKYEVFIQHTLVQVDSKGNEITKWVGGNDLTSVLSHLK